MRKEIFALLLALVTAVNASAQISIPNTFVANTRIVSADVNENFAELGDKALNREGGAMTGTLVIGTAINPDSDGGATLGTALLQFSSGFFEDLTVSSDLTVAGNFNLTGDIIVNSIEVESTTATSIDTAGGITAGTPAVAIIGTDGKIPAISSGFFGSLSGANLTGLLEANIADGTVLARLAANETVTGNWTFTGTSVKLSAADPILTIVETGVTAQNGAWQFVGFGEDLYFQTSNDALNANAPIFVVSRTGTVVDAFTLSATAVVNNGRYHSAVTQPGFLAYVSGSPVTGAADGDDVNFSVEVYDTASNLSSGVFTAPITGIYNLCFAGSSIASGTTFGGFKWNIQGTLFPMGTDYGASTEQHLSSCIYVQMSATNTARVEVYESGSETMDYSFVPRDVMFSGRLVQ